MDVEQETSGLEVAAESAVANSGQELDRLERGMRELTSEISAALDRMKRIGEIDGPGVKSFEAATAEIALRFDDFLTNQREVLSSLNIALFGRTGAGKSTLLSALGQLDGSRVSPGDSDWTVAVEDVEWHGCRLIDTPGIGGWGGRKARQDLEVSARHRGQATTRVVAGASGGPRRSCSRGTTEGTAGCGSCGTGYSGTER